VKLLPLTEFAYNNSVHSATGFSPFYVYGGRHSQFTPKPLNSTTVPAAEEHAQTITEVHKEVYAMLQKANKDYKRFYDQNLAAAPQFKVGDRVWLSHENITTDRPSHKLSHRQLGPFQVVK